MRGSEIELVAAALVDGDVDAFGELVRRNQSQVRILLMRLCRDRTEADDLAQECFVTAWQKLAGYKGTGSFAGWLLRIAWTTFLQARRKQDRYREVIEQYAGEPVAKRSTGPPDEVSDLDRLLAALGEQDRAVLILAYACGLSHREISDATGLPVGTVKSIIFRCKQKLRQEFDIEDHRYG